MRPVKRLVVVVVAVVALGALVVAARVGPVLYSRAAAVRGYRAQGFQMVDGCNGGAAVQADGQVCTIKQYLEELSDSISKDTNVIARLRSALVLAQEKARVLGEDCRKRGHCDTYPWKTNWVAVSQALTAFENSNQ